MIPTNFKFIPKTPFMKDDIYISGLCLFGANFSHNSYELTEEDGNNVRYNLPPFILRPVKRKPNKIIKVIL